MPKLAKRPKNRTSLILISTLAAILLVGVLYLLLAGPGRKQEQAIPEGTPGWQQDLTGMDKELGFPTPGEQPTEPEEQPEEGQAPAAGPPIAVPAEDSCERAYGRIKEFLTYLDQRSYVSFYELEGGTEKHFAGLLAKLYATPPVVVEETESLFTILKNTAHFYRTLGRSNVSLIKDILEQETKIIEPTMADFYRWSQKTAQCGDEAGSLRFPLENLYQYSAYFLNTLGGQSYLFRRPPRVRTLVKYYSVLVLDQANEQEMNQYGIDIRPAIDSLIEEMEAIQNLSSREEYLRNLQALQAKYYAQYGAGQ